MFTTPVPDRWYKDTETLQLFEVIDCDSDKDFIEIQYDNGDVGEFSFDDWSGLNLLPSYPPDDWSIVWELQAEDRHQHFGEYDYHHYLENIECDTVEEAFETLSHVCDSVGDEEESEIQFH